VAGHGVHVDRPAVRATTKRRPGAGVEEDLAQCPCQRAGGLVDASRVTGQGYVGTQACMVAARNAQPPPRTGVMTAARQVVVVVLVSQQVSTAARALGIGPHQSLRTEVVEIRKEAAARTSRRDE
jgi:hypothetical protein